MHSLHFGKRSGGRSPRGGRRRRQRGWFDGVRGRGNGGRSGEQGAEEGAREEGGEIGAIEIVSHRVGRVWRATKVTRKEWVKVQAMRGGPGIKREFSKVETKIRGEARQGKNKPTPRRWREVSEAGEQGEATSAEGGEIDRMDLWKDLEGGGNLGHSGVHLSSRLVPTLRRCNKVQEHAKIFDAIRNLETHRLTRIFFNQSEHISEKRGGGYELWIAGPIGIFLSWRPARRAASQTISRILGRRA